VAMAYAIIRTGGKQYRVSPGETISVQKVGGNVGDTITFEDVIFRASGKSTGSPDTENSSVTGKVVAQFKAKKVIAYKFKRRKGYHRTVGHRQQLTRVKIESIGLEVV
jgi:large subunit ribosomal protein L21